MKRIVLVFLLLVAGCGGLPLKPYAPVVVPEMQPAPPVAVHPSGALKATSALSVAPTVNPPLRPLTDPRSLTIRIKDDDAFGYVWQSQADKLVPRQANQVECMVAMESQVIALEELANYVESLPGGSYIAQKIDGCIQTIAPRLDVDYRVRELMPDGVFPPGDPRNMQNSKSTGWRCSIFGRFYRCPKDRLEDARAFLLSSKVRKLAAVTLPPLFPDMLDVRIVNADLGAFCVGGSKPNAPCSSNGGCSGGTCRAALFTLGTPPVLDSKAFLVGLMSSNHFVTKPTASQLALLGQADYAHAYASARQLEPTLPPGPNVAALHQQFEASAVSTEQQMLFTIDPFIGLADSAWSEEDRGALFAAAHLEGHMGWGACVRAGDQGCAGILAVVHSNWHRCIVRKTSGFQIRPFCAAKADGGVDYDNCPNVTCAEAIAQFKTKHPAYRQELLAMIGR